MRMLDTFDTLDAVPESQRPHAVETKGGKFVAPKLAPPDTKGGESAIAAERKARKDAEKELATAQKALADAKLEQEARDAKLPADQLEKWKKERDDAVAAEQAKTNDALKRLAQVDIERDFRAIAGLPDVNVYMERLDDDNLQWMTRGLGRTANGTLCVIGADGQPTTDDPKTYIVAKKTQRPYLFRGPGSSGSGSETSDGNGATSGTYDPIAAGKAAAAAQKKDAAGNALAFR